MSCILLQSSHHKSGALKTVIYTRIITKQAKRMRDTPGISGDIPHSVTWSDMLRPRPNMVRVARLELAASWSQTRRPTNWATPGCV